LRQFRASAWATSRGFGAACAFLCSTQEGFITGQNLTIDGGAYPGVF
jgi:3-oxoacyl-[acyl-carrier protein] reductase